LKSKLLESTLPAVVKAGILAPDDVVLRKQVTSLEPTKTSFFAALNIETKITKGCVEILGDLKICSKGKKVGNSEAILLQMLNIKPFTYGLKVTHYWENDYLNREDSYNIDVPTESSVIQVITEGYKNVVAVGLETNYCFKQMEEIKRRVENLEIDGPIIQETSEITDTDANQDSDVEPEGLIDFFF